MYRLRDEDKKRFARRKKQYRSHKNKDPKPLVDGPASKRDERLSEILAKAVIENSFPLDPEAFTLARILDWCFVARSEEMGILESPTRKGILVSGDGTLILIFYSWLRAVPVWWAFACTRKGLGTTSHHPDGEGYCDPHTLGHPATTPLKG